MRTIKKKGVGKKYTNYYLPLYIFLYFTTFYKGFEILGYRYNFFMNIIVYFCKNPLAGTVWLMGRELRANSF
jgi:hypothetical protein